MRIQHPRHFLLLSLITFFSFILTVVTGNNSQTTEILFFPLCCKCPKCSSEIRSSGLLSYSLLWDCLFLPYKCITQGKHPFMEAKMRPHFLSIMIILCILAICSSSLHCRYLTPCTHLTQLSLCMFSQCWYHSTLVIHTLTLYTISNLFHGGVCVFSEELPILSLKKYLPWKSCCHPFYQWHTEFAEACKPLQKCLAACSICMLFQTWEYLFMLLPTSQANSWAVLFVIQLKTLCLVLNSNKIWKCIRAQNTK